MFRIATSAEDLCAAAQLVNDQYARRDYGADHAIPNGATFIAEQDGQVVGTVTLVVKDAKVCELVRLASTARSTEILAGLFALVFHYGTVVSSCSELRIEVNPRHVGFYRAALGFEPVGSQYVNGEVNAQAQQMRIKIAKIRRIIAERPSRTLYVLFPEADCSAHAAA